MKYEYSGHDFGKTENEAVIPDDVKKKVDLQRGIKFAIFMASLMLFLLFYGIINNGLGILLKSTKPNSP